MRLVFTRPLAAPPEAVWPLITVPRAMSRWSLAPVELIAAGDGGLPWGVGAMRSVSIAVLGSKLVLREVIETSEAPQRLVYRVLETKLIRAHRGEQTLRATPTGSELRWTVELELAVPELPARAILTRQLEQSLDALARIAAESVPIAVVDRAFSDDPASPELWRAAEAILEVQRGDTSAMADDPKQWFGRVYAYVTAAQLEAARSGRVVHLAWLLRLIPVFHRYYADNLAAYQAGAEVEPHWQSAFRFMEGKSRRAKDERRALFGGLLFGIRAHIEEDLPRALAEVWSRHYRGRCDYARFRADYARMTGAFERSSAQLIGEIRARLVPWWARIGGDLGAMARAELLRRRFYDIDRARRLAFDRGERIAKLLEQADEPVSSRR